MRAQLTTAALATVVLVGSDLSAQRTPPAPPPPVESCSYDACALRVDPGGFFSRPTLRRGIAGERVERAGFTGFDLPRLVQGSDSAMHYARAYRTSAKRAGVAGLVGGLLAITAVVVSESTDASAAPYSVAATALGFYTGFEARRALGGLSRSLWWYNQRVAAPR